MGNKVHVQAGVSILWALLLLTVPLPWLGAIAAAAAVHELGHLLALLAFGGAVVGIQLRMDGACISSRCPTPGKALLCTLAGPAASALLVLGYRQFPRTAVCALVQLLYNLLPIAPLDGGRCLHLLAQMTGSTGERICREVERTGIGLAWLGIFWMVFVLRLGILPLLGGFILWYTRKKDLAKHAAR